MKINNDSSFAKLSTYYRFCRHERKHLNLPKPSSSNFTLTRTLYLTGALYFAVSAQTVKFFQSSAYFRRVQSHLFRSFQTKIMTITRSYHSALIVWQNRTRVTLRHCSWITLLRPADQPIVVLCGPPYRRQHYMLHSIRLSVHRIPPIFSKQESRRNLEFSRNIALDQSNYWSKFEV